MATRMVPAIKLKEVVGEPTVAIQAALNAGTITKNPNGKAAPGQFIPLGYFVGRVSDQVEHKSKRQDPGGFGETQSWPKLVGDFKCWSVDSERDDFVSPQAFLMDHITLHLGNLIRSAREQDPHAVMEVLFEVGVETSDKSSTGFTWALRDMAKPVVRRDPLGDLVAQIKGEAPPLKALADQRGEPGNADTAREAAEQEGQEIDGEKSDETEQREADAADAVSKDTGAGKIDKGDARGGHGKRR